MSATDNRHTTGGKLLAVAFWWVSEIRIREPRRHSRMETR